MRKRLNRYGGPVLPPLDPPVAMLQPAFDATPLGSIGIRAVQVAAEAHGYTSATATRATTVSAAS